MSKINKYISKIGDNFDVQKWPIYVKIGDNFVVHNLQIHFTIN